MSTQKLHLEPLAIHAGQETPDPTSESRAVPIYQTTAYVFHDSRHAADRFALRDHGLYGKYFPEGGASIFTFEVKGGQDEAW